MIRTRFAPSPTGYLHIGGARTALFSWLFARHHHGEFVLRVEDTDRARSTPEATQAILDGMQWLGLDHDQEPVYQSQRGELYRAALEQLLNNDQAYHCHCSKERLNELRETAMAEKRKPRYDGHCRDLGLKKTADSVVRFKTPLTGETCFTDMTRGSISVSNQELDDLVIWRPDDTPTYNFCVVLDDIDMSITHVIRGDDHINNTPRQIAIYRALDKTPPQFGHVPMILGKDGSPLSKRHGAVSVTAWRDMGYLREAVLNQLVRLGWSHGDEELFSVKQMIELFSMEGVNRKASVFDTDKLDWLNQHYLKTLPLEQVLEQSLWHWRDQAVDTTTGPALEAVVNVQRERVSNLRQLVEQSRPFYEQLGDYDPNQAKKHLRLVAAPVLECLLQHLQSLDHWQPEQLHEVVHAVMTELDVGMGKVGMPLRVALMGHGASPGIDQTLYLIGRERSIERVQQAIEWITVSRSAV